MEELQTRLASWSAPQVNQQLQQPQLFMSLEDALRTLAVPHAAQDSKVAAASSLLRQCTEQPDHVLDVIRSSPRHLSTMVTCLSAADATLNAVTAQAACGLLQKDPDNVALAELLASAGAISALLLLLDRPCSEADSAAQMWSCQALALMAYRSRSLAASMLKADAVSRLLNLLPVSSVQAQAAGALAAIAAKADGSGQAMEPAIKALVSVLQLGDPSSWEIAAAALGNIAGSSGSLASQVASLGSVQFLAQMLARTGETDTQGAAAGALAHMASGSNVLAAAIMKGGVLQPLIRLLSTGSVNARKEACTALGHLAQASRHNGAAIKKSGAILPLMRCMQTDDAAQQAASFALRQLG